jgi:hypothetical protein
MKILYISPENTVGTLCSWKRAHEAKGNECTFITLYKSKHKYDPGICLNLPLINTSSLYLGGRHRYYQRFRGEMGDHKEKEGYPPVWEPNTKFERMYFQFRDWLWHFTVEPAIESLGLMDYDIIHLEWGLEFYRDGRFVDRLAEAKKHIVCTYHGQDMRTRGVISKIDSVSSLNVTSELDLLKRHPNIYYLFLPFNSKEFSPDYQIRDKIRICHCPTNRHYKGSDTIIPICETLEQENKNVEFILIENQLHDQTLRIKQSCDILVDQVHNRGGWGYGMNSIEALSMGLCCVTELIPDYIDFIPDNPFVNVNSDTLKNKLQELVENPNKILEHKKYSKEWVIKYHDLHNTVDSLYEYYSERKWV